MSFKVKPILETMIDFYEKPRNQARFDLYLQLLKGDSKDDLLLPIGAYNPMAKEHVLEKLYFLKKIKAEEIMQNAVESLVAEKKCPTFQVVLNLADDFGGGWTNRFTTDYDHRFKLNALVSRGFCTPILWSSEAFDEEKIIHLTLLACYRTLHWLSFPKPTSLEEHIFQEKNIAQSVGKKVEKSINFDFLEDFYQKNKHSEDFPLIFNFLYGDDAAVSLGYTPLGIKGDAVGLDFSAME
jgi:hypothetical protein